MKHANALYGVYLDDEIFPLTLEDFGSDGIKRYKGKYIWVSFAPGEERTKENMKEEVTNFAVDIAGLFARTSLYDSEKFATNVHIETQWYEEKNAIRVWCEENV